MPENLQFELRDLSEWEVETVRMTAFSHSVSSEVKFATWEDLVGTPPENIIDKPRQGIRQEEGSYENGGLILKAELGRVDLIYAAKIGDEHIFSSTGNFSEATSNLATLIERIFSGDCPPLKRIAFGAILNLSVADKKTGYEQLSPYLPSVQIDPDGSRDFLYRINRPKDSLFEIPNLTVNRLATWSVASLQSSQFVVRADSTDASRSPLIYACRLELDINTSADYDDVLPSEGLVSIIDELINQGKEIITHGDVG